jgi:hypothetical protein
MSDYRYNIVKHNGVDYLHVMIDCACDTITQTNIPLDNIQGSVTRAVNQELAQSVIAIAEKSLLDTTATETYWGDIITNGIEDIINLCKRQIEKEGK